MKIKFSFFFAWYDAWVGLFFDQKKRILYVCPLPCCVFKFEAVEHSVQRTRETAAPLTQTVGRTAQQKGNMKDIHEMALDLVNPGGGELTENQEAEVFALVDFATSVLQNYIRPTKDALDLPKGGRVMYFCEPCHAYHVVACPNTASQ